MVSIFAKHNCRLWKTIVITGHRIAISPSTENCNDVPFSLALQDRLLRSVYPRIHNISLQSLLYSSCGSSIRFAVTAVYLHRTMPAEYYPTFRRQLRYMYEHPVLLSYFQQYKESYLHLQQAICPAQSKFQATDSCVYVSLTNDCRHFFNVSGWIKRLVFFCIPNTEILRLNSEHAQINSWLSRQAIIFSINASAAKRNASVSNI